MVILQEARTFRLQLKPENPTETLPRPIGLRCLALLPKALLKLPYLLSRLKANFVVALAPDG